jgi:hypothetical protein
MAADRGGTTFEFWIGADVDAVAAAFRNASTLTAKTTAWSDSLFSSAFWASRLFSVDWTESVVSRLKLSKSARLTGGSPLVAAAEPVAGGVANTVVRS